MKKLNDKERNDIYQLRKELSSRANYVTMQLQDLDSVLPAWRMMRKIELKKRLASLVVQIKAVKSLLKTK